MPELSREEIIKKFREEVKYTDEVAAREPFFFRNVAVQLRDAWWQVEYRGAACLNEPKLEDAVDAIGERKGFVACIQNCMMQPSPSPDLIRLVISEDPSRPVYFLDVRPESIVYITSVMVPSLITP